MTISNIGLVAAMPQEIRPFLRNAGRFRKERLNGFSLYTFSVNGTTCRLIESGIGTRRAEAAFETLIAVEIPDVVVSFGFCGAVLPSMAVGDVAMAGSCVPYEGNTADMTKEIAIRPPREILENQGEIGRNHGFSVKLCEFITSARLLNKNELRGRLPEGIESPVLDMETWGLARMARDQGIPFLAVRAVSDGDDEELPFCMEEFLDKEMKIRITKVMAAIIARPGIIAQLMRLGINAGVAGTNMAVAVKGLLESLTDGSVLEFGGKSR